MGQLCIFSLFLSFISYFCLSIYVLFTLSQVIGSTKQIVDGVEEKTKKVKIDACGVKIKLL